MKSRVFINRNFRSIIISHFTSTLGRSLRIIAIPWLILVLTSSPLQLGVALALGFVPDIILFPIIGHLIDVFSKKRAMINAELLKGGVVLTIPILYCLNTLTILHIYGVLVCLAILDDFYYNTRFSIIPTIVEEGELDKANSFIYGFTSIMSVFFFALGGALINYGIMMVVFISAIAHMLSGSCLFSLNLPKVRRTNLKSFSNFFEDFSKKTKEAIAAIKNSIVIYLLITGLLINIVAASLFLLISTIGWKIFGSPIAYTTLIISFNIGLILGNYLQNKVRWRAKVKYWRGIFLLGIFLPITGGIGIFFHEFLYMSFTALLGSLSILLICVGLSEPFFNVSSDSIVQTATGDEIRGKVATINNTILEVPFPLSLILTGWLVMRLSPFYIFIIYGFWLFFVGIIAKKCLNQPRGKVEGER